MWSKCQPSWSRRFTRSRPRTSKLWPVSSPISCCQRDPPSTKLSECDVGSFCRAGRQICPVNALRLGRVATLSDTRASCRRFQSLSHREHGRMTLRLYRLVRSNAEDRKCRGDLLEFLKRYIFVHRHVRSRSRCSLQVSPQDGCALVNHRLKSLRVI
jgi:hypothetical protein